MRVLALDTATEGCSAALRVDEWLIERESEFARGSSEHILRMIDEVLAQGGVRLRDLDAVAFGRGPGSFSGVRLAASVAQGLAFGAGLPVVPISDLAAVAQRVFDLGTGSDRVLVCNDARMQEVYWACFERDGGGEAQRVGEEKVGSVLSVELPSTWTGAVTGAGRGWRVYPELRSRFDSVLSQLVDHILPGAAQVARLAVRRVREGRVLPAEAALPVYLRNDVARIPSRK